MIRTSQVNEPFTIVRGGLGNRIIFDSSDRGIRYNFSNEEELKLTIDDKLDTVKTLNKEINYREY